MVSGFFICGNEDYNLGNLHRSLSLISEFLIQPQKFKFKEITKVSTKFYIKNDNGNILSMDGKTRYTLLEGKAAYDLLNDIEGSRR